jgi:trimethylamine-N-oxide reductase cytochrome c-type subunit TorC
MSGKKKNLSYFVMLLIALVVVGSAGAYGIQVTGTMEFCASCHEMKPQEYELKFSSHAKDKNGKPIGCGQCHLPAGFGPKFFAMKSYLGAKDLYVHLVIQPENLDRAALQKSARRFMDDGACLACHENLYKDAKGEMDISAVGRLAHDSYLGKNGQARSNCAGCHINLAHLPEFDQWLDINAGFKSRLLKEEVAEQ